MTWTFDVNQPAIGTGAVGIFRLKTALKAAGWTVPSSSDGTTYNASGDQITSGASGAGGMANTNAWFRIKEPGTNGREFTFQRGTTSQNWRSKYSGGPSTGFVGGSPSATQTPTATDEQVIAGAGTDASPTYSILFQVDATPQKMEIVVGGAAEGYSFCSWTHAVGAFPSAYAIALDVLEQPNLLDQDPAVVYMHFSGSAFSDIMGLGSITPGTSGCRYWFKKNLVGAAFVPAQGANIEVQNLSLIALGSLGSNPYTGADELFPAFYWRTTSPTQGYKGISRLFKYSTVLRAVGDQYSVNSTRDHVWVGTVGSGVCLPWDGSVWVA